MSDYMFMLENHLTADQARALAEVQLAAVQAGVSLYLTGGAVRDMLGGFPIRDLDFVIEGNALKLAKDLEKQGKAEIVEIDDNRKSAEMLFPGGVTVQMGMAHEERYAKPGGKAHVTPSTIYEDLKCRDFTVNALALSLNKASRGLLLDPANGLAELERKELRAVGNYALYDSPIRLFRMIRFKVRMGYQIAERTQLQYENARLAEVEKHITPAQLLAELEAIANEPSVGDILQALDETKLLTLVSPILTGPKLNLAGLVKLQKARQLLPFGIELPVDYVSLMFYFLAEKLTPKERAALVKGLGLSKKQVDAWQKLEPHAKKLEKELKSVKLQKPSLVYQTVSKAPGELILFLLTKSTERLVNDRLKNYLQKYILTAQEVTDQQVEAAGAKPGTPKFQKLKELLIKKALDARPKKVEPVPEALPPVAASHGAHGRR